MSAPWSLRRGATIAGLGVAVLVLLALLALATLWFVQRDQALPGTYVAGVEVSGMTAAEIRDAVEPLAEQRETDEVVFTFGDERYVLVPAEVGYRVDRDATAETALRRGREGLPGDIVVRVRSLRNSAEVELVENADPEALDAWVDDLADELDQEERRGAVEVDAETTEVSVELPRRGIEVDRDELRQRAASALAQEASAVELPVPATTTPQAIADADVEAVAEQLEEAVAEPLVLRSGDTDLTLAPTDLAAMIEVVETSGGELGTTLVLQVGEDDVDAVIGEVASGRFDVEPVDAGFTAPREPPERFDEQADATYTPVSSSVSVEPGREGRRFDPERAAEQLTELVRSGAREAELDLQPVEAGLPDERAEELRPTHAIGTFTTYFQSGQDRNTNIQLLADTVDGTVVLPGEQFSINETSGERTCDVGYVPAGTIIDGELVDTCGGGTSQFGTTTFNAAFFAGVQLDQWRAHSWYIGRYPMGREATLSYPVLDVRFTNTTDGAILVKTDHDAGSVTVTLHGQPRATAVSALHGDRTEVRDYDSESRTTSELSSGSEQILQPGGEGFRVTVTRTVELEGGGEETDTIETTYQPQTRIIERGE